MDVQAGLLSAIYAAPADDPPRLVLADWLLEREDPRGELIALQYQRRSAPPDVEAQQREARLLEAHAEEWLGRLAVAVHQPTFERGFLSSAVVYAKEEALVATAADPAWQTVESLNVLHAQAGAASTPAARLLGRLGALRTIALSCETADVVGEWVGAVAPIWRRLVALEIVSPGLTVRMSRRAGEGRDGWLRAELAQAWTHWANQATAALFDLLESLRTAGLRGVHIVDSRPQDRLTHRELRRMRRLLERYDRLERVKLPKA